MTMTRQHFALIAGVIKETLNDPDIDECVRGPMTYHLSRKFARALSVTHPTFNRERFLRACGVEG